MTENQMESHREQMEAIRDEFNRVYREKFLQLRQLGIDPKTTFAYTVAWIFFVSGQDSVREKAKA